ncbi:transferrin-binding protein-like solute binding protein [Hephaestia sp. GCM10023244]|uniref:transferrin-binding protein-like solute binding protein n=1 Tax=unclassified Hephaestia TaxID=2631281 RepID=UPI0020771D41|nr:transferrin-binding protein-like solute binding protein [Hephaestia sp. MAHUQ-44]MCM8729934.1 transferrin-binding protein-like solute binding protein [Hephaestia sp. MAHUQ-44]
MRATLALLSLPLLSLAACGGGDGVNSLGTIAPPGGGSGIGFGDTPVGNEPAHFLDVSTEKTFDALGSFQSLVIDPTTHAELYRGNASSTAAPSGTISYNPRDGIFTVAISDTRAGVSREVRFQDPAHRTDYDPNLKPVLEAPDLAGFNYLAAADGSTFFYQRPGTTTKAVTLAGFVHLEADKTTGAVTTFEHGATVFGDPTSYLQVPIKGTGHYEGDFLATMINQASFDTGGSASVFQWLVGSSSVDVDFAKSTVGLGLSGTVGKGYVGDVEVNDLALNVPSGTAFNATGSATIDTLAAGFVGKFTTASFGAGGTAIPIDFTSVNPGSNSAGASSIDGRFYGKNATELGGNFRIVGGIPDQRIDIHGAFTGAAK